MSGPIAPNPTTRFLGLAERYAKYRPTYPREVVDRVIQHCRLGPDSLLVDVGCGTGISSRLFAERGIPVLGIDPNAEMRCKAEQAAAQAGEKAPVYQEGKAEETGLPDASADAVLAAQAFHWFEQAATLREFHRILKPGGWVVLLWNERDDRDAFTAAVTAVFQSTPERERLEKSRLRAGEPLLQSPLFQDGVFLEFEHEQKLDEEGLLGRAFSASYAPRDPAEATAFADDLRKVFARFQKDGTAILKYQTTMYAARRRELTQS